MKKKIMFVFFCIIVIGLTGCNMQKSNLQKQESQERVSDKPQKIDKSRSKTSNDVPKTNETNENEEEIATNDKEENLIQNKKVKDNTNDISNTNQNISTNNNTYIVNFNLDGGDKFIIYNPWKRVDNYILTVKNGETYGNATGSNILPGAIRYGNFVFDGWYTEKNGRGNKISTDTIVSLNSNIELYAYWVESIDITYRYCDDSGNSISNDNPKKFKKNITFGEVYQDFLAHDRIINGNLYVFEGFYSSSSFTEKLTDTHVIQNNEILYIKYIPNEFDAIITSKGNGTVRLSSNRIKANGSVTIYANAERGYEVTHILYCAGEYCNGYGKDGAIETNIHGTYGWRNKVITNYTQEMWYPSWDGGALKIEVEFSKIN